MTMEKKHHGLVGDTIHRLIHAFMAQNNSTCCWGQLLQLPSREKSHIPYSPALLSGCSLFLRWDMCDDVPWRGNHGKLSGHQEHVAFKGL